MPEEVETFAFQAEIAQLVSKIFFQRNNNCVVESMLTIYLFLI